MKAIYYSNCLIEAIRAKIKNHKVKIAKIPSCVKYTNLPHYIWIDEKGNEFDFSDYPPNDKKHTLLNSLLYKGRIRHLKKGTYKEVMDICIDEKFYDKIHEKYVWKEVD